MYGQHMSELQRTKRQQRMSKVMMRELVLPQELGVLGEVLEGTPFLFALELAAAASARDALALEPWLQERLASQGAPFAQVPCPPEHAWPAVFSQPHLALNNLLGTRRSTGLCTGSNALCLQGTGAVAVRAWQAVQF